MARTSSILFLAAVLLASNHVASALLSCPYRLSETKKVADVSALTLYDKGEVTSQSKCQSACAGFGLYAYEVATKICQCAQQCDGQFDAGKDFLIGVPKGACTIPTDWTAADQATCKKLCPKNGKCVKWASVTDKNNSCDDPDDPACNEVYKCCCTKSDIRIDAVLKVIKKCG